MARFLNDSIRIKEDAIMKVGVSVFVTGKGDNPNKNRLSVPIKGATVTHVRGSQV
jgi:hypothetical protein